LKVSGSELLHEYHNGSETTNSLCFMVKENICNETRYDTRVTFYKIVSI
jgi:hypothetical protein